MKINDPALFSTEIERIRELVERVLEIVWLVFFYRKTSIFAYFVFRFVIWPRFNEQFTSFY